MKHANRPLIILFSLTMLLLQAVNAWALQPHGEPEGLYVHQMAHALFMVALAYLYWHTRLTTSLTSRGWMYLRIFCVLFFCWNLIAFTGHAFATRLNSDDFIDIGTWNERLAPPITLFKAVYFILKMDHVLNVPALLALFISLRIFYHEAREEMGK